MGWEALNKQLKQWMTSKSYHQGWWETENQRLHFQTIPNFYPSSTLCSLLAPAFVSLYWKQITLFVVNFQANSELEAQFCLIWSSSGNMFSPIHSYDCFFKKHRILTHFLSNRPKHLCCFEVINKLHWAKHSQWDHWKQAFDGKENQTGDNHFF